MIIRFFCHDFRILPKTRITLGVVNILSNYRQSGCDSDGSMWKTEQLNSGAVVGEMTSRSEPRMFSKLFGNCKRCNETRQSTDPNIYLTSRRASLSRSAELLTEY